MPWESLERGGEIIERWVPEEESSSPEALARLQLQTQQAAARESPSLALSLGKSLVGALPAIAGSYLAGPGAGWAMRALGGGAGEFLAQELGLKEKSTPEVLGAMIPAPAASAERAALRYPAMARKGRAVGRPETIAGLAEEAFGAAKGAGSGLQPTIPSSSLFKALRANPQYQASIQTQVPGTPPIGMFGPSGAAVAKTITSYPVALPETAAVSAEAFRRYKGLAEILPGMAEKYASSATRMGRMEGTVEEVHNLTRTVNNLLRNPGTLTGEEEAILKQIRAAAWRDLDNSQTLAPEIKAANQAFKREAAAETFQDILDQTKKLPGAYNLKTLDMSGFLQRLDREYASDEFLQNAVPRPEFEAIMQNLSRYSVEQKAAQTSVGSLASYGLAAGTAGSLGAQVTGHGAMAAPAIAAALPGLAAMSAAQKEAAFGAAGEGRRALVERFRTPQPNLDVRLLEYPQQGLMGAISQFFRLHPQAAPTGPSEEEELRQQLGGQ